MNLRIYSGVSTSGLILITILILTIVSCKSESPATTSETIFEIRQSLDKAGYDDIKVTSTPVNRGVTLNGTVASDGDKADIESITRKKNASISVEDRIAVIPPPNTIEAQVVTQTETISTNYDVVRVFYATDRKPSGGQPHLINYSGEESDNDAVALGTLEVSIPKDHDVGKIERPFSIWRFEFREDPNKQIVLLNVSPKPEAEFFKELSTRVAASANRQAFVFVHGFDVSFPDAARRTAQIAYDLDFDGAPILYSWPSKGNIPGYPADEAEIEWTTPHLKQFLEKVAAQSQATNIYLIAHSIGARALTSALSSIAIEHTGTQGMFNQLFLAAPDIKVGVFRHMADSFPQPVGHVTLYASSKDRALKASKRYHQDRRAGDSADITVVPMVDTIDATAVDTEFGFVDSFLGHSYYAENRSVLTDIFNVMQRYNPPSMRFGMRPNKPAHPTYWIFKP
jgi:esterase/lipase superfamily enzyme